MKNDTFWIRPKAISRRTALKAAGVSLALPFLESMAVGTKAKEPQRMLCVMSHNGFISEYHKPSTAGFNYVDSDYTKILKDFKNDFTVFSGVSHPEVDGAHATEKSFLTGAPHPGSSSFRNSISVDQYIADRVGHLTRFPCLPMNTFTSSSLSVTQSGVTLPAMSRPSGIFKMLFMQGTKAEIEAEEINLSQGRSILDKVNDRAKRFAQKISKNDKEKLEQFMDSVRGTETKLGFQNDWLHKPKPKVNAKMPRDVSDNTDILGKMRLLYEMSLLAFETDSTRLATLYISSGGFGRVFKVHQRNITDGWHPLTHAMNNPKKRPLLKLIEEAHFIALNEYLGKLKEKNLLDNTMVLHGSNLGMAARHISTNLPLLLAGGGFKHGQHLAFSEKNNKPMANILLSMIQRMGVECDRFSSSTGTMTGLELA